MSMELRRVTSALVRSPGPPRTSRLTPSSNLRWTSGSQLSCELSSSCSSRRHFNSTTTHKAMRPTAATATPSPETSSSSESQTTDVNKSASSLGWTNPSRPRFGGRLSRTQEELLNGGSSADSVLQAMNRAIKGSDTSPASSFNFSRMQDTNTVASPAKMRSGEIMSSLLNRDILNPPAPLQVPLTLKPHTGRTVQINGNVDVGRGFRMLEQVCARNKVRSEFSKQRFHERGGLKKKRLRRERWKRIFMDGFRATVWRVKQMKQQGW